MAFEDFTQFSVWQKGFELVIHVYEVTKTFPPEERYGITSDIRRASNSVIHNIAEGFGRFERKDKTRFYKISRGSAYEVMSQALTCKALSFLSGDDSDRILTGYKEVINEIDKIIKTIETR